MIRARYLFACCLAVPAAALWAQPQVRYFWSGALTARSIRVNVQLTAPTDSLRLVVAKEPGWAAPRFSAYTPTDSSTFCMVPLDVDGLEPNTPYHYRFEVNGVADTSAAHTGTFGTAPEGPGGFSFVVGSCNGSSNHPVWTSMAALKPLFLLCNGDLHYGDPSGNSPEEHRTAYEQLVLSQEPAASLLRQVPLVYVWDDHDFCGNASDATAPGRYAAFQAYREYVPHHPLAYPADTMPVYQSFTIGRVHFIVSDMRSTKTGGAMMDARQHAWLRAELLEAEKNGLLAVWVTSLSWNAIGSPENWGSQPGERNDLCDFLRDNGIRDLLILCGDAHMLAIDSGANGDFSTGQNDPWKYPVFQAAAINRGGSYKGGTYDQGGYFPNPTAAHGQFGQVLVNDDGEEICVTLQGFRTDSMGSALTLIDHYTFCRTPLMAGPHPPGPDPHVPPSFVWLGTELDVRWEGAQGPGSVEAIDAAGRSLGTFAVVWNAGAAVVKATAPPTGTYVLRLACGAQRMAVPGVVEH
jgi:alkaline phosphatase D